METAVAIVCHEKEIEVKVAMKEQNSEEVMEKEIKDCGLVVMPKLSHWNFIENPVGTDAILNSFLLGGK